jgi:hypothetical protein
VLHWAGVHALVALTLVLTLVLTCVLMTTVLCLLVVGAQVLQVPDMAGKYQPPCCGCSIVTQLPVGLPLAAWPQPAFTSPVFNAQLMYACMYVFTMFRQGTTCTVTACIHVCVQEYIVAWLGCMAVQGDPIEW